MRYFLSLAAVLPMSNTATLLNYLKYLVEANYLEIAFWKRFPMNCKSFSLSSFFFAELSLHTNPDIVDSSKCMFVSVIH